MSSKNSRKLCKISKKEKKKEKKDKKKKSLVFQIAKNICFCVEGAHLSFCVLYRRLSLLSHFSQTMLYKISLAVNRPKEHFLKFCLRFYRLNLNLTVGKMMPSKKKRKSAKEQRIQKYTSK